MLERAHRVWVWLGVFTVAPGLYAYPAVPPEGRDNTDDEFKMPREFIFERKCRFILKIKFCLSPYNHASYLSMYET